MMSRETAIPGYRLADFPAEQAHQPKMDQDYLELADHQQRGCPQNRERAIPDALLRRLSSVLN